MDQLTRVPFQLIWSIRCYVPARVNLALIARDEYANSLDLAKDLKIALAQPADIFGYCNWHFL